MRGSSLRSCHRNFFGVAGLEVLKLDPNLLTTADFNLERVQATRRGARAVADGSRYGESAVMAWTKIMPAVRQEIDIATRVRTDDIEGLNLTVGGAPQINSA